ncbi:MAG: FAD-dependent oxidoreductase [Planctomycetota bacterium]|nr:FAD-dependent oxidoreductase [Planctomycetota bacterium]
MAVANPDWRPARVVENRAIARASVWLTLEAADGRPAAFEPGHVLGVGLKRDDGEMLRHAYTVSAGDPAARRFSHLYRVIPHGRMTPLLETVAPGATLYFHGPGHNPIQREVRPEAERIVGIATGTGLGPLYGYAAKTLREGETRPLTLYAGFREAADLCLEPELRALAEAYPNFAYRFSLSRPHASWTGLRGRVDQSVPPLLGGLSGLHVHLVGNGEMVHLWRPALRKAGMEKERVTIETYFNHHAEPGADAIEAFAERLMGRS